MIARIVFSSLVGIFFMFSVGCSNEKKCESIWRQIQKCEEEQAKILPPGLSEEVLKDQREEADQRKKEFMAKCKKNDEMADCEDSKSCLGLQACLLSSSM